MKNTSTLKAGLNQIILSSIIFALLLISGQSWGQTPTNGGFENDANSWTTGGTVGSTNARTGVKALSHTTSSTNNVAHTNSSTISVPANYYGHVIGWALGSNANARASCGGTLGTTTSSATITTIGTTLTRLSYSTPQNGASAQDFSCRINTRSVSGSTTLYWDDVIMYTSNSSAPDITKPVIPTSFTNGAITSSSVGFSWTNGSDAGTGIQNTIILRTTNLSATTPVMNDQGVYSTVGGTSGPNVVTTDWTVISTSVASGTTTYTDNTVSASTSYKYAIVHRDLAYNYSTSLVSGTVTTSSSGNTAPTVTTQAPTSILTTTATGNGNITATGGVDPTVRGICWDLQTNADPDINDSKVEETGTFSTGAFTGSITGLTAGTQYKVRAYATNSVGTSYGSVQTFYTLSAEPSAHATGFTATANSSTQIDLSFSAASTISNAAGYLILQKTGSAPTGTPADAMGYTSGNTIGDGTVAAIVNNTSSTTASITGLTAGTHYYFTIFPYNWDGTNAVTYNYKTDGSVPVADATTLAGIPIPTITTTVVANSITTSSANTGGQGLADNGNAISEKGVCYSLTTNPTIANTKTSDGSGTADFTSSLTPLTAQTKYFAKAYATNGGGTGYGPEINFYTLSNEPTVQASGLAASTTGTTTQTVTWSLATFPSSGATTKGYLLLRAVSPNVPSLTNSDGQSPVADANTTIVSQAITSGTSSYSVNSLTACTGYIYKLVPFCWDGTNTATYNYLFDSAPVSTVKVTACALSDAATAGGEATVVSSLENSAAPLTSTTGTQVWQFTIRDGGSAADADDLPTLVSALSFTKNAANGLSDWQTAFKTVALFDGTTYVATGTVSLTDIQFTGLSLSVPDNGSSTYSLRLSLNSLPGGIADVDNKDIVFSLLNSNITTPPNGTSSRTLSSNGGNSANDKNVIEVIASKLYFSVQPTTTGINNAMIPAIKVAAVDANNNTDLNFSDDIRVSSNGTMSGSPVSVAASNGVATFSTLTHTVVGTNLILTAERNNGGAWDWDLASGNFDITLDVIPANSYRTTSLGTWSGATWERFISGVWTTNAAPSTSTTDFVYIRHAISNGSMSPANIIIDNNGTLTITGSSTFGSSLLVKTGGTLQLNAALTVSGTFTVESGGVVNINYSTASGVVALWNGTENFKSGSTFNIQNWAYGSGSNPRLIQNPSVITANVDGYFFGNLIISGAPTSTFTMVDGNQTINLCKNDFTVSTTSGSTAITVGSANATIGGNLIVTSGLLSLAATTTGNPITTILGNITPIGGTINLNQNSSGSATSTAIVKGNLIIPTGVTLTSTDPGCKIIFGGTTEQNVSIVPSLGANVAFEVNSGATAKLINQNLALTASTNPFSILSGGTLDCTSLAISGSGAFTLASGATLKTASATGINGSITTGGTKTFDPAANYFFNGTSAQVTGAMLPATVNNLTIDNAAGVTLSNSAVTVNGTLLINSGKKFEIGAGKQVTAAGTLTNSAGATGLVIKSNASGTGSLKHNTNDVPANIDIYITGNSNLSSMNYHQVSIPVNMASPTSGLFMDSYLFSFNESLKTKGDWEAFGASTTAPLDIDKGYLVFNPETSTAYNFSGTLRNGSVSPSLSFTDAAHGFNLIPNPYPSSIDWTAIPTKSNLADAFWIWNGATNNYGAYGSEVGTGTSGTTQYIPVGQAFFVRANAASPVITLTNAARAHSTQAFLKNSASIANQLLIKAIAAGGSDEAIVAFKQEWSRGTDAADVSKMTGGETAPQLSYTNTDGLDLSINALPFSNEDVIVPINFSLVPAGEVTFTASGLESFESSVPMYLEDLAQSKVINLREQANYTFSHSGGDAGQRFQLRFKGVNNTPDQPTATEGSVFVSQGYLYIEVPSMQQTTVRVSVYDALGREFSEGKYTHSGLLQLPAPTATGVYVVRVQSGNKVFTAKVVVK